jgi:hypothetical protein
MHDPKLAKCLNLAIWLTLFSQSSAKGQYSATGATALSLGGCRLMVADAFSPANNCAQMPSLKNPGFGISFTNPYLPWDIRHMVISAAIPINKVAYGVKLSSLGNGILSDQILGLCFAHAATQKLSFGLGANYNWFNIIGYGRRSALSMECSMLAHINEKLSYSFAIFNLLKSPSTTHLNRVFYMGILYKVNPQVDINIEMEKGSSFMANMKAGCSYKVKPDFYFNIGFASLQAHFTFGICFKRKRHSFGFASQFGRALGISNNFSIIYEFAH